MRQRKIKNIEEKVAARPQYQVLEPAIWKGRWNEFFQREAPLGIEIGCGKGQFATRMAQLHPDWNFLAFEGNLSVGIHALEKAEESGTSNLRFILQYVQSLGDLFEDGEVSAIWLNFSDPWPKDRHAKRRLTYGSRFDEYARVLGPSGFLEFKTDNDALFDYTLEQLRSQTKFTLREMTRDLHGTARPEGAFEITGRDSGQGDQAEKPPIVTTEYEDKFIAAGKTINYMHLELNY